LTAAKARGDGSGWDGGSDRIGVSKPISERLPMVNRRVMAQYRADMRMGETSGEANTQTKRVKRACLSSSHRSSSGDEAS
jgi:hypothetical protein